MQKRISFGVNETIIVENETIRGILLDMNPIKVDGVTVCDVADLNKVAIKVSIQRKGQQVVNLYNGYLENVLRGLYSGTTKLEIVKTKRASGYNVELQFGGVLDLREGDKMEVQINAQNTSFTALSLGVSNINFETIPAVKGGQSMFAKVVANSYTTGDTNIDKVFEPNTFKVVLANDYVADYLDSIEAKVPNGLTIKEGDREVKKITENLLISENLMMFEANPETTIKQLVVYSGAPLRSGSIQMVFNKGVTAAAKLITLNWVFI